MRAVAPFVFEMKSIKKVKSKKNQKFVSREKHVLFT